MQTGPREKKKKISIRFVPNKTASTKNVMHNGINIYPLYLRVIFNQKSNHFPYIHNLPLVQTIYTDDNADSFFIVNSAGAVVKSIAKEQIEADFQVYEDQLTHIIRYEYKILGDKQTVKGIYDRFIKYSTPLQKLFREDVSNQLLDFLEDKLTFRQFKEMQEWERQRIRSNPLLSPDDPIQLIKYLQKETNVDVSDFPISIRQHLYSLALFIQFQEIHSKTVFSLYHWLIEMDIQKMFASFIEQTPSALLEASSCSQLPDLPMSTVLHCLQRIVSNRFDQILK